MVTIAQRKLSFRGSAMRALPRLVAAALVAVAGLGGQGARCAELVAVGTEFSRVFERTPTGEYVGLGADVIREFARQSGDTVRFEIYPWPRAQAMVENNQADILIGPYKTPEREARFAFADKPFYQDQMLFYARAGQPAWWSGDYAQLKGVAIGTVSGWVYGTQFDMARTSLQVSNVPKLENGILMLTHGRVDLLAANRRNIEPVLVGLKLRDAVVAVYPIIDVQSGYMAFPKAARYDALRVRFDKFFNHMVDKGELARLARRYDVNIP